MVYNYQSVPLNKKVYCVGFRCGSSAIPSVNCKPTLGIVKMCKYYGGYREFISNKDNTFVVSFHEEMQNRSYYYFTDTYEEAVKKYNELVDSYITYLYDISYKVSQYFIKE